MITKFENFLNESKGQNEKERKEKKKTDKKRDKERKKEKWKGTYQDRKTKKKPLTGVEAERAKEHRKELSKYLNKTEMKELDDQQKNTLLSKRKYHGAMNDDDLINSQIKDNQQTLVINNLPKKED